MLVTNNAQHKEGREEVFAFFSGHSIDSSRTFSVSFFFLSDARFVIAFENTDPSLPHIPCSSLKTGYSIHPASRPRQRKTVSRTNSHKTHVLQDGCTSSYWKSETRRKNDVGTKCKEKRGKIKNVARRLGKRRTFVPATHVFPLCMRGLGLLFSRES